MPDFTKAAFEELPPSEMPVDDPISTVNLATVNIDGILKEDAKKYLDQPPLKRFPFKVATEEEVKTLFQSR